MSLLGKKQTIPLRIRELAVDPDDVDRETYPVRLRLSRVLTPNEARALATVAPAARAEGDAVLLPDAKLDDIAHEHTEWTARLEQVETMAAEMDGSDALSAQRDHDDRLAAGSHLNERHDPYYMS